MFNDDTDFSPTFIYFLDNWLFHVLKNLHILHIAICKLNSCISFLSDLGFLSSFIIASCWVVRLFTNTSFTYTSMFLSTYSLFTSLWCNQSGAPLFMGLPVIRVEHLSLWASLHRLFLSLNHAPYLLLFFLKCYVLLVVKDPRIFTSCRAFFFLSSKCWATPI